MGGISVFISGIATESIPMLRLQERYFILAVLMRSNREDGRCAVNDSLLHCWKKPLPSISTRLFLTSEQMWHEQSHVYSTRFLIDTLTHWNANGL